MNIPFNKPFLPAISLKAITQAAHSGTISGNGKFTKKCHRFFEKEYGFRKVLLTTSCTDALEMAGILSGIVPGDEVILPSFTFMSTANAFLLRGAKLVFADTLPDIPNIDPSGIEKLITPKTRVIAVVHYSGIACDMDQIMEIAGRNNLFVVEDAAHAFDSFYKGKPLGSIGHFGTFSFHETKNITCGEGGMIAVNESRFIERAEIIWEKGTNRAAFYRGEVDKYGWVDIGSSFLPSDAIAAILFTQLKMKKKIQSGRVLAWNRYYRDLKPLEEKGRIRLPVVPDYATGNGNLFYFFVKSADTRNELLAFLKKRGVNAVFHYLPLHSSSYFLEKHDGRPLPNTDRFSDTIIRLPFFYGINRNEIDYVVNAVNSYFTT
jgi:dTDP-4-amino-4,6-dideoxygalactose transaminase